MQIEYLSINAITPYANNPRLNDGAVDAVAASIREFGWKQPLVVDADGVIVAGHTRYKAALKLGMDSVPVIRAYDLTPEQVKAYRLADNKVAELAAWDFGKLEEELAELDMDMAELGFGDALWFDRTEKDGDKRQEGNEEYNAFLDKFEEPKTTDDCYTPDNIYEVIADWVAAEYGANRKKFMRPFYPGGDYQKEAYPAGCVVVDNPPFSILREIVDFYRERGIKFFLFAPALAALNYIDRGGVCAICTYAGVTFENGARVPVSFLTNLEPDEIIARATPDLYSAIDAVNKVNEQQARKELPKYDYPTEVLTAAGCGYLSKYGQAMKIYREDGFFIRALDAQKESGKGIFGGGLLLSKHAAAEKAAAEKAAAEKAAAEKVAVEKVEKWQLSDREREIVKSLGQKGVNRN